MKKVLILAAMVCMLGCSVTCTSLIHPTNTEFLKELRAQSANGLGLVVFAQDTADLQIRFFDDRLEHMSRGCCSHAWPITARGSRFALIDRMQSPNDLALAVLQHRVTPPLGGPVVLVDVNGTVLARSLIEVDAWVLSISRDSTHFAFIGLAKSGGSGVYIGDYESSVLRRIMDFEYEGDPNVQMQWALDWSADDRKLLVSSRGVISEVDIHDGSAREVAQGGNGRWSPQDEWITFANRNHEPVLMDLGTRTSRIISGHHGVFSEIEWSPDGRNLLIPDSEGCYVLYGCLWVYRIADEAFVPILHFGQNNPRPQWILDNRTASLYNK